MIFKLKLGYLATQKEVEVNNRGSEIKIFNTPTAFRERYMPLTDEELKLETYGDNVHRVLRMFVDKNKWLGKIHTGDRAYLYDEDVTTIEQLTSLVNTDTKYCVKANYQVTVCAIQNFKMKVEFQKIREGN